METKHKNNCFSFLALYRISTFAGQMLEDTFLVNSSMSGKTTREEKKNKIENVWWNPMTS